MSTLRDMYVSLYFDDEATSQLTRIDRLIDRIERNFHDLGSVADTSTSSFHEMVSETSHLENEIRDARDEMQSMQSRIDEAEREMSDLRNEVENLNGSASETNTIFGGMAGSVAALVGALGGVAIGATVISTAMEMDAAFGRLEARTGATGAELKELEGVTKEVFRSGFGESITQAADDIATLRGQFKNLTEQELAGTAKGIYTVTESFDQDFNEVSRTVSVLTKNFEGLDATTALDGITYGFQNGLNYSDEFLDTLREYSPQFSEMGMSMENMMSVLQAGSDAGSWSLDKIGDSIKESHLRMSALDKTTVEAYKSMGFKAEEYVGKIAKGGDEGNKAFQEIIGALQKVEDETERNSLATDLFGTTYEDLRENVIFAMADATTATAEFGGATQKAADALHDNFGARMTKVWRDLSIGMAEAFQNEEMQNFMGTVMSDIESAVPSIKSGFSSVADTITNTVVPAYEGFKTGLQWVLDNKEAVISALSGVAAGFTALKVITVVKAALDLYKNSALVSTIATQGFNAALRANPIGMVVTVIGLLVAAGVYLYQNWDTVKAKAGELWVTVKEKFADIKQSVSDFIQPAIGWFETIGQKWDNFKTSLSNFKVPEWVSTIGGKISGAAGKVKGFVTGGLDGSHATGLANVGWDGYRAELHKGEAVLTAKQSNALRSAGMLTENADGTPSLNMGGGNSGTVQQGPAQNGGGNNFVFHINGENAMDIAQKVREAISDYLDEQMQIN